MDNVVERAVADSALEFVERMSALTSDAYFREAVLKMTVREITWSLFEAFNEQRNELAEQLELMAELVTTKDREALPGY